MDICLSFCKKPHIKFSEKETGGVDVNKGYQSIGNSNQHWNNPKFIAPFKPSVEETRHFKCGNSGYQDVKNNSIHFKTG
ncbi:MAG: hypothetical protein WCK09_13060 [Bacteroidota bacterium]